MNLGEFPSYFEDVSVDIDARLALESVLGPVLRRTSGVIGLRTSNNIPHDFFSIGIHLKPSAIGVFEAMPKKSTVIARYDEDKPRAVTTLQSILTSTNKEDALKSLQNAISDVLRCCGLTEVVHDFALAFRNSKYFADFSYRGKSISLRLDGLLYNDEDKDFFVWPSEESPLSYLAGVLGYKLRGLAEHV